MTPLQELPFLVVHGSLVWKALLILLVLGSLALIHGIRRHFQRVAAKATADRVERPVARARGVAVARLAVVVGVLSIAWYLVLRAVGSHRLEAGDLSLAAALPGSRGEALARLAHDLEYQAHTERTLQLRLELDELRGACSAGMLWRAFRFQEAVAAARACGDGQLAAWALASDGRFEEAWREPGRASSAGATAFLAIATRRWDEAAGAITELAARPASGLSTRERERLPCLAQLLRSWADERGASERWDESCGVYAAIARRDTLTLASSKERSARIASATLGHPRADSYNDTLPEILAAGRYRSVWFAPFKDARMPADVDLGTRVDIARELAAYLAIRGDFAGARSTVAALGATAAGAYPESERASDALALALLDPVGAPAAAKPGRIDSGIDEMLALRRGQPVSDGRFAFGSCNDRARQALAAAQSGDGLPLAELFEHCDVQWDPLSHAALAVLPRVTSNRERLAAALRYFHPRRDPGDFRRVRFDLISEARQLRDIARLAGDHERAEGWQALIERHLEMLEDPRTAIALLLLDEPP